MLNKTDSSDDLFSTSKQNYIYHDLPVNIFAIPVVSAELVLPLICKCSHSKQSNLSIYFEMR